jgi:chromosome segregation ATPase
MGWLWQKLFGGPADYREEVTYKRRMLQLQREQLQVEVDTQEGLEQTLLKYRQHLQDLRSREAYVISTRDELIEEVKQQRLDYEQKGEKDLEFERKATNTEEYLNTVIVEQIDTIREKMRVYELQIDRLQLRIDEIAEIREHTEKMVDNTADELGRLEVTDGGDSNVSRDDDSRMLIQLEEATMDIPDEMKCEITMDSITQVELPQQSITYRDQLDEV